MKDIDWHAGFVSAMKLELRKYEDILTFDEEHYLANRAQKLDLLIIRNDGKDVIGNPIGRIFSRHNIFEYKGIGDVLTYGKLYKTLAYTSLYLYELHKDDECSARDYTMSFVRYEYPKKLFLQLARDGIVCNEVTPGIYAVSGLPFKTQIIVSGRLPKGTAIWLRSLTVHGTVEDVEYITSEAVGLNEKHKDEADNIMNIFTAANSTVMQKIKKEGLPVCQAVNELFADEIKELKIINDAQAEQIVQKDVQIEQRDMQIEQKDAQIEQRDAQIEQKDMQIAQDAKEILRLKSILLSHNISFDEL